MAVTAVNRPTKAIISTKAIKHNIQNELKRLDEGIELFAVVKANAYGHGLFEVATAAREAGATGFCVAYLDEALALRQAGFTECIFIMGVVRPIEDIVLAAQNNLSVVAADLQWLEEAELILKQHNLRLKIHLAIDTGMGRIGFTDVQAMQKANERLLNNESFEVEGIFTHFSTADEKNLTHFKHQQQKFEQALAQFTLEFRYIHTSNTATALWHDAWHSNMIRFGIGLYGMNPSGTAIEEPYQLEPVMSLVTEIVFIKQLPKNEAISYGATYLTTEDEWIATLPIGYADGLNRRYTGFEVLVDGKRCPIVGRVCMDQTMIKLPKYYPVGTEVVIIGKSKDQINTFEMAAEHVGTINYELTCAITERVKKIYE